MKEEKVQVRSVQMIVISDDRAGQRIDNYLQSLARQLPRSRIYRMIRKGEVRINGKRVKPDYKLQVEDKVRVPPMPAQEKAASDDQRQHKAQIVLKDRIVSESSSYLIIDKPTGLAVHGGSGISFGLIELLRALRPENQSLELVHRLDRDTSGLIIVAKKRSALRYFHQCLQQDQINKVYWALVHGQWSSRNKAVEAPLKKNTLTSGERIVRVDREGKASRTEFRTLQKLGQLTLIEAKPITGRTHQIRVHCQWVGNSIVGDEKYGYADKDKEAAKLGLKRLCLHAKQLSFHCPDSKQWVQFDADLDSAWSQVLASYPGFTAIHRL